MANKKPQALAAVPQAPQPPEKQQNMSITFWDGDIGTLTYQNIIGHQVGQHWVAVITSEDETIVFSAGEVKQIRVWKE
jgi:hypothetical protein